MADSDGALDYALAAMDKAATVRAAGEPDDASRRGIAASVGSLPALDFSFKSPSFLSARSRWVLFAILGGAGFLALWLSYRMAVEVPAEHGAEWIWPPIMSLVVAAVAFALAYATVMGFGNVEIKTTVGGGGSPEEPATPKPPKPGKPDMPGPGGPGPMPDPSKPGPPPSATSLAVTRVAPVDNASAVDPDVVVEASFSAPVVPPTASPATFSLRRADGALVAATVSVDGDGLTARLHPMASLDAATAYRATVTTGVRGEGGQALAAARTWTFTTA